MSDEDRIFRLENNVSALSSSNATMRADLESLTIASENLTRAVADLTATLNKSRGALWALTVSAAVFGAVIGWATAWFHR